MSAEQPVHQSVMLEEVLDVMPIHDSGFYIDGTFGRGGHSRALLSLLGPDARLTGIDRDPQAVAAGRELERADARFHIVASRFDCIAELAAAESRPLMGVLLDLGVSSPQLDDASRGFSFLRDGPLDMRMNPEQGLSAAQWLMQADEKDIADVLYQYGEERKSRRIARRICEFREQQPLVTTGQLAQLVEKAIGRSEPGKHPATRTFQAIRIHINQELESLHAVLDQAVASLAPGGRLVVISFHSLEDRIVKHLIRDESGRRPQPRGLPIEQPPATLRAVGKAIKPSREETERNPRARSAVLRVAEKLVA